ncbi:hypothetical protein TWF225_002822 [Orbilia oligospora]|nr:hypothetical protein TWF751_003999 [Orbilia oligospora]KAF3189687.1 hypothetical protein TWF225_002822 [Orbilia oligospora]KAF3297945.1 hypothetical protein TWF132_004089 [Orbilia oligospora]
MSLTFQVKNLTSSVTLTYVHDPWNPIGITNNPTGLPSQPILPGGTSNLIAAGSAAYIYYTLSGPNGPYSRLQVRWFGVPSTGAPLPGGPAGWWDGPAPTDVYFDDTDRVTDHVIYLRDTPGSKVKKGLVGEGVAAAPVEEVRTARRAELAVRRRQVEEQVRERREAAAPGNGPQHERRQQRGFERVARV